MFVWVDFRRFFLPRTSRISDTYTMLQVTSPHVALYQEREAKIIQLCSTNGVLIKPGSAYRSEELGWFRITFTLPEIVLREGLSRIGQCLEEIESVGW